MQVVLLGARTGKWHKVPLFQTPRAVRRGLRWRAPFFISHKTPQGLGYTVSQFAFSNGYRDDSEKFVILSQVLTYDQ